MPECVSVHWNQDENRDLRWQHSHAVLCTRFGMSCTRKRALRRGVLGKLTSIEQWLFFNQWSSRFMDTSSGITNVNFQNKKAPLPSVSGNIVERRHVNGTWAR